MQPIFHDYTCSSDIRFPMLLHHLVSNKAESLDEGTCDGAFNAMAVLALR